jgi:hypothetical protein
MPPFSIGKKLAIRPFHQVQPLASRFQERRASAFLLPPSFPKKYRQTGGKQIEFAHIMAKIRKNIGKTYRFLSFYLIFEIERGFYLFLAYLFVRI